MIDNKTVIISEDSRYKNPQLNTPFFSCLSNVKKAWGEYWDLYRSSDTAVKKLVIYPEHRFSYQYHNDRDEVWMIVSGKGQLWLNDTVSEVGPGSHIYIKRTEKHRLANAGNEDLVFFEIQYGKCSEEDIIRLADDYGRT